MNLQIPWLFMGPATSGKLTTARKYIETVHNTTLSLPLEERKFTVGDNYEARVLASPYHFEIDIPNLSMQDKQIIGELLTTFFKSGDVLNALRTNTRKLVILRRAHALSLPAAVRVRAIIHQYVLPPDAGGMLWMTAREMSGSLALLSDAFVIQSVPRMQFVAWCGAPIDERCKTEDAYDRCNGRVERAHELVKYFPPDTTIVWPRRIRDYYDETVRFLIRAARSGKPPNLTVVNWVRARIYQALSLCQNAPDIIDSFAASVQNNVEELEPRVFWLAMTSLSTSEPHTSYRTPLSLEAALLRLYEVIRTHSTKKSLSLDNEYCNETVSNSGPESPVGGPAAPAKRIIKKRSSPIKKRVTKKPVG
jgi:hypothetical protein